MCDATRPDLKPEDVEALIDYLGQVGGMVESPRHISTVRAMKAKIESLRAAWFEAARSALPVKENVDV